jgi:hypothetical protein
VIVTFSLPPWDPHHSGRPPLTAHPAGSKLTVSKQPIPHSLLRFSPRLRKAMENQHPSAEHEAREEPLQQRLLTPLTVDEIIADLAVFTVEQRSLAWSPEPPFESAGASNCRLGGSCGLDFNWETRRARWIQARHRWNREQKRLRDAPSAQG